MFSRFKHIFHFLLVAMVVMGGASCTRWRERKEVVVEADGSLAKGVIMKDTAALAEVIRTLEPYGRLFAREDLVKAYYLLGRNMDDYYHDFSTAADYYIEADRLNTKDPILRGRINSCMGFLCKQDSCFEGALEFYKLANDAFKESRNERRYAIGLLNIAEQYINLKEYTQADSILKIANNYELDSAYHAMLLETRGLYFFGLQQYDSALMYFLSIENYPRTMDARCYNYLCIMRSYEALYWLSKTHKYAEYIIAHSNNSIYRSNAYYYLMVLADNSNDISGLSVYSHAREDENRSVRTKSESYAKAAHKLKVYLDTPHPYLLINWCIFGAIIVILILCIIAYSFHKHKRYASHKTDEMLRLQKEKSIADRELFERQIFDYSVHFLSTNIWKDNSKLREQANIYCGNIFYRLEETYHLSEQEIKICLMVLLDFSREQMANYLYVQPNTISKSKSKIAKKLGTSSAQLREFLITFLV